MTTTTLSAREFSQDASKAKREAKRGPVIITDRGRPSHVLLTYEDYERLSTPPMSLAEAVAPMGRTLSTRGTPEGANRPQDQPV
ncbi:MAG: type II toxin-antitoxin system Phd/YefM family antitoxin [Caulobacteraceae bacterium]